MKQLGVDCIKKYKIPPHLLLVVLPEGANEIYTAVKQYVHTSLGYLSRSHSNLWSIIYSYGDVTVG